jgi:hypothetical protein
MGRRQLFRRHSEHWTTADVTGHLKSLLGEARGNPPEERGAEFLEPHTQADFNLPLAVEVDGVDVKRLAEGCNGSP